MRKILGRTVGNGRVAIALSTLAVVFSLGGTAFAAATITSASIVDNTIRNVDIRDNTITGADIRTGTIQAPDIGDGEVDGLSILDGSIHTTDFAAGEVAPRLFAIIEADGSISSQAGVTSTVRNSVGNYSIVFVGQFVTTCAATVTPFNTASGTVRLGSANGSGDTVVVQIKDAGGTPVDERFNLAVIC